MLSGKLLMAENFTPSRRIRGFAVLLLLGSLIESLGSCYGGRQMKGNFDPKDPFENAIRTRAINLLEAVHKGLDGKLPKDISGATFAKIMNSLSNSCFYYHNKISCNRMLSYLYSDEIDFFDRRRISGRILFYFSTVLFLGKNKKEIKICVKIHEEIKNSVGEFVENPNSHVTDECSRRYRASVGKELAYDRR
jgi:hypothetical protein